MQVNVPLPIKYLGVDYAAGNQTITDSIALELILLGLAVRVTPLPPSWQTDLAARLAAIGSPVGVCSIGTPFVILPGDGAAVGLFFTGTAGAFTLSAAILANAWNALKGCWCYLPANFGGKTYPAGWYWAVFSSDTAGILYNNVYSSGDTNRPAVLTPFADNLSGWLTQTTSEVTGPTGFTYRGGSMGPSGTLKAHSRMMGNITANKTFRIYLGSTQVAFFGTLTTNPNSESIVSVRNQASESLQLCSHQLANPGVGQVAASFLANEYAAIDTKTDKTLSYSLQISTNAACAILLHADVSVTYGA